MVDAERGVWRIRASPSVAYEATGGTIGPLAHWERLTRRFGATS
jgi:hypothetical protein